MKDPEPSRQFIDLIRKVSTKSRPNWNPGSHINVGDYGTINDQSGALRVEGNIYKEEFPTLLDKQGLEINLSDKSCQPQKAPVGADTIITSSGVEHFPGSIPYGTLVQAEFLFKKGEQRAVLIMPKPQKQFMPLENVLKIITKATKLRGKYLVTSTFRCQGYYFYLSSKSGERLIVALTNSRDILHETAEEEPMQWWNSGEKATPRQEYDPGDQCRFTPLYTLQHIANRWWLDCTTPLDEDGVEVEDRRLVWEDDDEEFAP